MRFMENSNFKNILIISVALVLITITSTLIVIAFNSMAGFSTDLNNEDVATSIAAVAFVIGLILKFVYEKVLFKQE